MLAIDDNYATEAKINSGGDEDWRDGKSDQVPESLSVVLIVSRSRLACIRNDPFEKGSV